MMTIDIYKYVNYDTVLYNQFLGVYSSNMSLPSSNGYCIFNSEPSYKRGKHWLAYFKNDNYIEFFDNCDRTPEHYDLHSCSKHNNVIVQGYKPVCRYYCLMYIMLRCRGIKLESIVSFMNSYTDAQIVKMFSKTFNVDKVIRTIVGLV